ncbi:MAG: hypothetical protein Q9219_006037 [cf. Caloplaca sp. 3 TL-2023]
MTSTPSTMVSQNPSDNDLTSDEDLALQDEKIIFQKPITGKRKVSTALLSPPSSHGSFQSTPSSSVGSTASIRFKDLPWRDGVFELPEYAVSPAAVEFCGFTPHTAQAICQRFLNRPNPSNNPDELIDYMRGSLLGLDRHNALPPREAMTLMGISETTQAAILHPDYYHIFRSQTTTYWALDTVTVNWKTLLHLQDKLKEAAIKSKAKKKKMEASKTSSETQPPLPHIVASHTAATQSSLQGLSSDQSFPAAHVVLANSPPAELPDHYVIWKGKAGSELQDNWINEDDGSLSLRALSTYPGGDFNDRDIAYYWTLERATAECYQQYARLRCPYSEIWLIQAQVSKSFIQSLRSKDIGDGPDWKLLVWSCKKGVEPPERLRDFELLKGHICGTATSTIRRIKGPDVQTAITEADLLYMETGRKATQWAFVGADVMRRFDVEVKGKVHVEITPPSLLVTP